MLRSDGTEDLRDYGSVMNRDETVYKRHDIDFVGWLEQKLTENRLERTHEKTVSPFAATLALDAPCGESAMKGSFHEVDCLCGVIVPSTNPLP
ncbi:MAG: hypothetical protein K0U93_15920, partial [Gammaproteobacteria bacterium]|nr:hypothetical protein [Gammaproteobacteria bacterium]